MNVIAVSYFRIGVRAIGYWGAKSTRLHRIFKNYWQALLIVPTVLAGSSSYGSGVVLINQSLSDTDPRYTYTYELLNLVLSVTEREFGKSELELASTAVSRNRTLPTLIKGQLIHVMAEAPKPNWNQHLLAVDIPIRKGLQGLRVFIIDRRHKATLASTGSLEQLKGLATGTGAQWSTRAALEAAGFNVIAGPSYNGLFKMLSADRFVTFSRGINEAYRELEAHHTRYPNLMVDDKFLLYIPMPTFFYVTPTRPELALRIREGLLQLKESGEFDRFFYRYHCRDLLRANMSQRMFYRIDNPAIQRDSVSQTHPEWIDPSINYEQLCQDMNLI